MEQVSINNRRYLGSKYKLLDFINDIIAENNITFDTLFDVFGGTGVVADYFYNKNKNIIINDILLSNYFSYLSWFGKQEVNIDTIKFLINHYNFAKVESDNYFSQNFSDTYFNYKNAKRIGFIRNDIEKQFEDGYINLREKAVLITSLIYALDKIANTVGHYDAYRKNGDLDKELVLKLPEIGKRNKTKSEIYNEDSNNLVHKVKADIAYLDPPYNSRQYCDAYHLLENIASWEKPEVFGVAKKMDRSHLKSQYCTREAPDKFKELIRNLDVKYILVSYNNMGDNGVGRSQAKITDDEIMLALKEKGEVKIYEKEFSFFDTGKTNLKDHKERIFLCKVGKRANTRIDNIELFKENVKSPLNYTGGKYKLLPQLKRKFPEEIELFVDMFSGGANVGVNIESQKTLCIDYQPEVIRLYNLFKTVSEEELFNNINSLIKEYNLSQTSIFSYEYYNCNSNNGVGFYNKDKYLKLRADYNQLFNNSIHKDYLFLLLIIYGFNNQIRFNSKKEFNMPVGKRDFNFTVQKNLKNFLRKIKNIDIEFINNDFRSFDISSLKSKNSFVYLDPPYFLGTASYNENNGWTEDDESDLYKFINKINENQVKFALSNVSEHKGVSHSSLIEWALKNKYNINYLNHDYNNSNYQSTSKNYETSEVLITNY